MANLTADNSSNLIIVFYGNCQIKDVYAAVFAHIKLHGRFELVYRSSYFAANTSAASQTAKLLSEADIIITNIGPDSRNAIINMSELRQIIKAKDSIFVLPFVRFHGYWPTYSPHYNEQFWYPQLEPTPAVRLVEKGNKLTNAFLEGHWEDSLAKLWSLVSNSDLNKSTILDLIIKSLCDTKLFHDEWHPHSIIIYQFARQVLNFIGIKDNPIPLITYDKTSMRTRDSCFLPPKDKIDDAGDLQSSLMYLSSMLSTSSAYCKFSLYYTTYLEPFGAAALPHGFLVEYFKDFSRSHLKCKVLPLDRTSISSVSYHECGSLSGLDELMLFNLDLTRVISVEAYIYELGFIASIEDIRLDEQTIFCQLDRILFRIPYDRIWYKFSFSQEALTEQTRIPELLRKVALDALAIIQEPLTGDQFRPTINMHSDKKSYDNFPRPSLIFSDLISG